MQQVVSWGYLLGFLFLPVLFLIVFWWKSFVKKMGKRRVKFFEEQSLENEIKLAKTSEDLIYIYEKNKSNEKKEFYYDILVQIASELIRINAFPKDVVSWLNPPDEYTKEDLCGVMEELIAFRSGNLKDVIAIEAYCDGFISLEQALAYTDKETYPETVALLISNPRNYDGIRETVEKESEKSDESLHELHG